MSNRDFWVRQAERALEKLAAFDRFGEDDFEDETVIRFDYKFRLSPKLYSYAAIKSSGLWYTTGPKSPKAYEVEGQG